MPHDPTVSLNHLSQIFNSIYPTHISSTTAYIYLKSPLFVLSPNLDLVLKLYLQSR
jgi:hypothetical protein